MLKIYYLSSEVAPFSSVNTVSTFSKEFASILNEYKDIDIRLTQPKYGYISDRRYILREVIRLKDLSVNFSGKEKIINLKSGFIPGTRVQVYFMEHEKYFKEIGELLYKSRNGRFYKDNNEKFTFFSKAAIQTLESLYWTPDYIICNDWQMSMTPSIIKNSFADKFKNTKVVFIVYEISESYNFENKLYQEFDLDFDKKLKKQNNLISGIKNSDIIYFVTDKDEKTFFKNQKKVVGALKDMKYKLLNYSPSFDTSDRIEVYNDLLQDFKV